MSRVQDKFAELCREVGNIARNCGRRAEDVKILAVSKTVPVEVMNELYACGVREFGENREPELAMKVAAMPDDIKWHFIGPLQANKIRKVVKNASVIHSVASMAHIERLERIAGEEGKEPEILLEVNVSGEASKGGFTPEELLLAAAAAAKCENIRWSGFMTMAPLDASSEELMAIFSKLRELRDICEKETGKKLETLSMGMSGDFPEAIACGATVIRVGSRIFK